MAVLIYIPTNSMERVSPSPYSHLTRISLFIYLFLFLMMVSLIAVRGNQYIFDLHFCEVELFFVFFFFWNIYWQLAFLFRNIFLNIFVILRLFNFLVLIFFFSSLCGVPGSPLCRKRSWQNFLSLCRQSLHFVGCFLVISHVLLCITRSYAFGKYLKNLPNNLTLWEFIEFVEFCLKF